MRALSVREKSFIFAFFCSVWAMLFALSFVRKEDPIHVADFARSHEATIKLMAALGDSVFNFLNTVRGSLSSSYNMVADLAPFAFELAAGSTSRAHFILALTALYLAPLCLLLPAYSWRLFGNRGEKPLLLALCLIVWSFLCLSFWPPLLHGLTDLSSLIPLLIALGLAVDTDFSAPCRRSRLIALGAALYLAFMFRRWYIFAIGSVYIACLITSLGALSRGEAREKLRHIAKNLLTAGLTTLLLIMIFQFPVFRGMILNKYSYKYAAFQAPLSVSLAGVYSTVGPLALVAALAASAVNLARRRHVKATLFTILCPLIFFLAVTRVQALDGHHTLGVNIYVWLAAFGGIINLYLALPKAVWRAGLCLAVTAYMVVGFRGAFGDAPETEPSPLFPSVRVRPLKHPNFAGLRELMLDMQKLAADSSTKIYIVGSSMILNEQVPRNNIPALRQHILNSRVLDKSDGIAMFQLMAAKYVVVADPIRAMAREDEQQVVIVPADQILGGRGLGRAYRELDRSYDLGDGVRARVFEKQRAFTLAEVREYVGSFPAERDQWSNPVNHADEMMMTAWDLVSDGVERQPFDRENRRGDYVIKSGHDPATALTLNFEGLSRVKFSLGISAWKKVCGGRAAVAVGLPGREAEGAELRAGETLVYDLELGSPPAVRISAEGEGGDSCDQVFLRLLESE